MNFAQFFAVTAIFAGAFFAWLYISDERKRRAEKRASSTSSAVMP